MGLRRSVRLLPGSMRSDPLRTCKHVPLLFETEELANRSSLRIALVALFVAANCPHPLVGCVHIRVRDGFTAAWVARLRYPEAELRAGYFGSKPPPVSDRHVLIVDFSYPRSAMEEIAGQGGEYRPPRPPQDRTGRSQ